MVVLVALVVLVEALLIMIMEGDQLLVLEHLDKVTLEEEPETVETTLEIQAVEVALVALEQVAIPLAGTVLETLEQTQTVALDFCQQYLELLLFMQEEVAVVRAEVAVKVAILLLVTALVAMVVVEMAVLLLVLHV